LAEKGEPYGFSVWVKLPDGKACEGFAKAKDITKSGSSRDTTAADELLKLPDLQKPANTRLKKFPTARIWGSAGGGNFFMRSIGQL